MILTQTTSQENWVLFLCRHCQRFFRKTKCLNRILCLIAAWRSRLMIRQHCATSTTSFFCSRYHGFFCVPAATGHCINILHVKHWIHYFWLNLSGIILYDLDMMIRWYYLIINESYSNNWVPVGIFNDIMLCHLHKLIMMYLGYSELMDTDA